MKTVYTFMNFVAASFILMMPHTAMASDSLASRYIALAIQGDLSSASSMLQEENAGAEPTAVTLREKFDQRFLSPKATDAEITASGFLDGITLAYEEYWKSSLLDGSSRGGHLATLESRLSAILRRFYGTRSNEDSVFDGLHRVLASRGTHFLESPDFPLRDLFLWQSEELATYTVQLTDKRLVLKIHFMDDFLLQGWKDYASLGLATTTGWVEDGELYCIAWAYDTHSENFEVSYLKHEGRHLLDLERYPNMESTELEYRAKLTELAFADRSLKRVLDDFTAKAAHNPDSPHAMANWRVVRDVHWALYGEELPENFVQWGYLDTGKINRLARELLALNSLTHQSVDS